MLGRESEVQGNAQSEHNGGLTDGHIQHIQPKGQFTDHKIQLRAHKQGVEDHRHQQRQQRQLAVQLLVSLGVLDVSASPVLSFVFRNSLYSGVFAMVGGLILVPIVSLFTQKNCPKDVEETFVCYKKNLTVGITDNLGK